ncbi:MAG: hypothetical protein AAF938_23330 [Myxococcota bacterium]
MAAPEPEDEHSEEPLKRSTAYAVFIAFVILQLVVPLTYYMRDDQYDERFAWRMFSAIRLYGCSTQALETRDGVETPLELGLLIHNAWINHLGRNRKSVAHAFLDRRCDEGAESVRIINQCRDVQGEPLPPQEYVETCDSGAIADPEAWGE